MKQIVSRTQCPSCAKLGNDNSHNNLINYDDGGSYCFACGFFIADGNSKIIESNETDKEYKMPEFTLESVLSKRNISISVAKKYGVTLVSSEEGELSVRVPITDSNGAEAGAQYRLVDTSSGSLTREMRTSRGAKLKVPYFGINTITKNTQTLLICEGWTDALIAATALEGRLDISVLGLCGASFAKRAAVFSSKYHQDKSIVLAFDNDDAGDNAKEVFVQTIAQHLPNKMLRKLSIPLKHKDLGDWVSSSNVDLLTAVSDAPVIFNSDILTSEDVGDRLLEFINTLRNEKFIKLTFSESLDSAVKLMPGKFIGILGDAGQGKSTLAEHFMLECITQRQKVLCISAEMSAEEVALKLMRVVRNEPLHSVDYLKTLDDDNINEISKQTKSVLKWLMMVDNFGSFDIWKLNSYLLELTAAGNKPSLIVVDHLLAISENLEPNSLQLTCNILKGLARKHQVAIIMLSHIKKPQTQNRNTVYRPRLSDAYGSNGLSIYADVVLAVAKDPVKKLTYVETVKQERLIGEYVDVTLEYQDWQLSEIDEDKNNKPEYASEDEDMDYEVF